MTYHQDHTWRDIGDPLVTTQDDCVHLHQRSFFFDHGHGYTLSFQPRHIQAVEELLAALRTLEAAKNKTKVKEEAKT